MSILIFIHLSIFLTIFIDKKFKVAEKPKDKAMQKALELRVKRAQKQHQALEDDMFAL